MHGPESRAMGIGITMIIHVTFLTYGSELSLVGVLTKVWTMFDVEDEYASCCEKYIMVI